MLTFHQFYIITFKSAANSSLFIFKTMYCLKNEKQNRKNMMDLCPVKHTFVLLG